MSAFLIIALDGSSSYQAHQIFDFVYKKHKIVKWNIFLAQLTILVSLVFNWMLISGQ